jgi:ring-1,2-phenylacetyl-CoA epoxidase subunit PaaC
MMIDAAIDITKKDYILYLADNAMVLGHRLSEWCGHGPVLEQDIAITNIALDQVGLARNLYGYLAELEGGNATEDTYPYHRDVLDFKNMLLVEVPNGDWGQTLVRQMLYDTWAIHYYEALSASTDERLAALAAKSLKEIRYHHKYSSEWVIRLGDGTEESHRRMQDAVDILWAYSEESLQPITFELEAARSFGVDVEALATKVRERRSSILREATLTEPQDVWQQTGGKIGQHTEHLGYILADLQHYQRMYPDAKW